MAQHVMPVQGPAAPPCDLPGLFRSAGALPRRVAGNLPFHLDDPNRCVLILKGEVDLFLTDMSDEASRGLRQHVFTLRAGDLLFGLDLSAALLPVSLLAVGAVGTEICEAGLPLLADAHDPAPPPPSPPTSPRRSTAGWSPPRRGCPA
ncbi:hypothetical protein [Azospirillum thermophilum]|uniref:Cyclic nucleotide-binding domain-containing protein n=1 Tax=Azospirillum thermophilum TaxID=2202148 RepID=A0A2S2CW79_9PROT|nr:hypothetical protein [Azospirillum thermophilum]AWK88784.1 hypothetical protein DEW08_22155 [Azospirillum thermophilum]